MKSEKSAKVKLGLLQKFNLADVDVLERVDSVSGLLNLPANNLGDELGSELSKGTA